MTTAPFDLRFVMSAPRVEDLPPTQSEVAFAGRSNVGKSSLINALARRKQLARVSNTPGRTQLLNLFERSTGGTVVDLPGYGYAKVPGRERVKWQPMIEGYLTRRDGLRLLAVLVDGEIGPTPIDQQMLEWVRAELIPHIIVATKADKVRPSKREGRRQQVARACGLDDGDVFWASSSTGAGIDALRSHLHLVLA
jgi:GTP-binding protein